MWNDFKHFVYHLLDFSTLSIALIFEWASIATLAHPIMSLGWDYPSNR